MRKIRDITQKDMDFTRFHVHECEKDCFALIMSRKKFGATWVEAIRLNTSAKRLIQLANDILTFFNRKAKIKEWKPTLDELKAKVGERYGKGHGMETWFIDWVRYCRLFPELKKDELKQIIQIYEWLKGNEDWLYNRKNQNLFKEGDKSTT